MINRFYLDFDGTLTGREGSRCVFSDFYQGLQLDPRASYTHARFKDNIVDLVKTGLARPENKTMRMSEGALLFLKTMLAQGADLNIVSKNRKEYIKAVLLAEGMEAELVQKITICDVNDLTSGKYQAVVDLEKSKKVPAGITIICDDNSSDCKAMSQAVQDTHGAKTTIISHSEFPGTFDWQKIARDAPQPTKLTATVANDRKVSIQRLKQMTEKSYGSDDGGFFNDLLNLSLEEQRYVLAKQNDLDKGMYNFGMINLKGSLERRRNNPEYKDNPDFQHLYDAVYKLWFAQLPPHQQKEILQPKEQKAPEVKQQTYESCSQDDDWEALPAIEARNKFDNMKTNSFSKLPVDDEDTWIPKHAHDKFLNDLLQFDTNQQKEIIQAQVKLPDGEENLKEIYRRLDIRVKYLKNQTQPTPELLDLIKTTLHNLQISRPQTKVLKFTP